MNKKIQSPPRRANVKNQIGTENKWGKWATIQSIQTIQSFLVPRARARAIGTVRRIFAWVVYGSSFDGGGCWSASLVFPVTLEKDRIDWIDWIKAQNNRVLSKPFFLSSFLKIGLIGL